MTVILLLCFLGGIFSIEEGGNLVVLIIAQEHVCINGIPLLISGLLPSF